MAGIREGEDLTGTGRFVPGDAPTSLAWTPGKQSRPFQPAPGQTAALADEPCPPGGSAECVLHPVPCPAQGCGISGGGIEPAANGAVVFSSAMLRLWRARGHHHLHGERL